MWKQLTKPPTFPSPRITSSSYTVGDERKIVIANWCIQRRSHASANYRVFAPFKRIFITTLFSMSKCRHFHPSSCILGRSWGKRGVWVTNSCARSLLPLSEIDENPCSREKREHEFPIVTHFNLAGDLGEKRAAAAARRSEEIRRILKSIHLEWTMKYLLFKTFGTKTLKYRFKSTCASA